MQPGDRLEARYGLEEPLGDGGMAEVWLARDRRLDRPVAVKFLDPALADDAEYLVRFFTEAQSLARISHPNVVTVLDFGEHGGRPFLVMEYVPGGSLMDITGAPIMPERALEIIGRTAAGVGAAHRLGIVHRDIKPGNILLDGDGNPRLADFGIAWSRSAESMTQTGAALGSPHYISPEQARGASAVPQSDVYSLGVVLYELLTGRKLFDADGMTAIAIAHVENVPTPPGAVVPSIPDGIDDLVMRCLAKSPDDRFPDGEALAVAIGDGFNVDHTVAMATPASPVTGGDEDVVPFPTRAFVITAVVVLAILGALAYTVFDAGEPSRGQAEATVPDGADTSRSPSPSPTG